MSRCGHGGTATVACAPPAPHALPARLHNPCAAHAHARALSRKQHLTASTTRARRAANPAQMALTDTFLKFFIIDSFFMIKEDVRPLAPRSRLIVLSFLCWLSSLIFFVVSVMNNASETMEITTTEITDTKMDGYTCKMLGRYCGEQAFVFGYSETGPWNSWVLSVHRG